MADAQQKQSFASAIVTFGWACAYRMLCDRMIAGAKPTELLFDEIEEAAIDEAVTLACQFEGVSKNDASYDQARQHGVDTLRQTFAEYRRVRRLRN